MFIGCHPELVSGSPDRMWDVHHLSSPGLTRDLPYLLFIPFEKISCAVSAITICLSAI
jgi:hypothetical protein